MQYTLTLSLDEINHILDDIADKSYKRSHVLVSKIVEQVKMQDHAKQQLAEQKETPTNNPQ